MYAPTTASFEMRLNLHLSPNRQIPESANILHASAGMTMWVNWHASPNLHDPSLPFQF